MTIPIFELPLDRKVLAMVLGGVNTTRDLAKECGVSYEEIEDLHKNILLVAPYDKELSRDPDKWKNDPRHSPDKEPMNKWEVSAIGSEVAKSEQIPIYPSASPEKYFERDEKRNRRFVPKWLAEDIMNGVVLKTMIDNGEMYFYNGGSYRHGGDKIVQWYVRRLLDNEATRNRENETVSHIISTTPVRREMFDSDPSQINLLNGVYDINDDRIRPHSPGNNMLVQIPIYFNKDADCPIIKKFVSEIVDGKDIPIIQEMFGYCLLRDYRFHKIFMMIGEGSNGKSTLLELLKKFIGENNIASVALQEIDRNRFSVSKLYGKLANIYSDLSDSELKETGKMKMLCGGDTISAEKKFRDYFEFRNYAKLIFSANRLPGSFDDSDAFFRRWIIIQFPNQFIGENCDPKLLCKLTSKDEMSGCFNWAIEGLKRLMENGCFSNEMGISDMRKLYRKLSSPIAAFSEAMLEEDNGSSIPKEELYASFVQFCKSEKLIPLTKPKFGKLFVLESGLLAHEGNTKVAGKNTRVWFNVKYK